MEKSVISYQLACVYISCKLTNPVLLFWFFFLLTLPCAFFVGEEVVLVATAASKVELKATLFLHIVVPPSDIIGAITNRRGLPANVFFYKVRVVFTYFFRANK
jgi:hypothetical protein